VPNDNRVRRLRAGKDELACHSKGARNSASATAVLQKATFGNAPKAHGGKAEQTSSGTRAVGRQGRPSLRRRTLIAPIRAATSLWPCGEGFEGLGVAGCQ